MRSGTIASIVAMSLCFSAAAQVRAASTPTAASPAARHLDRCPGNIADFENSDATSNLVKQCLGQPTRIMPGRGSDVIWNYDTKGGTVILVFVFDNMGVLTHFRAYSTN
jgi:hypothetical protein